MLPTREHALLTHLIIFSQSQPESRVNQREIGVAAILINFTWLKKPLIKRQDHRRVHLKRLT
jgi:hypothetical protein